MLFFLPHESPILCYWKTTLFPYIKSMHWLGCVSGGVGSWQSFFPRKKKTRMTSAPSMLSTEIPDTKKKTSTSTFKSE